jgi:hypothetical protein
VINLGLDPTSRVEKRLGVVCLCGAIRTSVGVGVSDRRCLDPPMTHRVRLQAKTTTESYANTQGTGLDGRLLVKVQA